MLEHIQYTYDIRSSKEKKPNLNGCPKNYDFSASSHAVAIEINWKQTAAAAAVAAAAGVRSQTQFLARAHIKRTCKKKLCRDDDDGDMKNAQEEEEEEQEVEVKKYENVKIIIKKLHTHIEQIN